MNLDKITRALGLQTAAPYEPGTYEPGKLDLAFLGRITDMRHYDRFSKERMRIHDVRSAGVDQITKLALEAENAGTTIQWHEMTLAGQTGFAPILDKLNSYAVGRQILMLDMMMSVGGLALPSTLQDAFIEEQATNYGQAQPGDILVTSMDLPRPYSDYAYAICLHEFGHAANTREGDVRKGGWAEAGAAHWALDNAAYWTRHMSEATLAGLWTYVDGCRLTLRGFMALAKDVATREKRG